MHSLPGEPSLLKSFLWAMAIFIVSVGSVSGQTLLLDDSSSVGNHLKAAADAPHAFETKINDRTLQGDEYLLRFLGKIVRVKKATPLQAKTRALGSENLEAFAFQDTRGSLVFNRLGNNIVSARLHDVDANRLFEGRVDRDGNIKFVEQDLNRYICVDFTKSEQAISADGKPVAKTPNFVSNNPSNLTVAEIKSLQSLPNSDKVIFIDYWGGVVSGTAWNVNYTAGADIPYDPFNVGSGNVAEFTPSEIALMYTGWADMAEDYAPFNVNVTASEAVFNSTPANKRVRLIVTPTIAWFDPSGRTGGVAYVGVFGLNRDFYTVGWSWADDFEQLGHTNSHETGHNMGLFHDGFHNGDFNDGNRTLSEQYYQGHGNWAPIMGGGFRKDYVQWSKGDYANAQQYTRDDGSNPTTYSPSPSQQNDLDILDNVLGQVGDDVAGTNASATSIDIAGTDLISSIRPAGLGTDVDVYHFIQGGTSNVNVIVRPLFQGIGTNTGVNLSLQATLTSSNGAVVAQVAPNVNPNANVLNFNGSLAPGDYYLRIENLSYNTSASNGFPEYANGGYYQVSVSGGSTIPEPDLVVVDPLITPASAAPASDKSVTLSAAIRNTGSQTATDYTVRFYRSTDDVITTSDVELTPTQAATGSLSLNQTSTRYQHVLATAPQEIGTYYYGVCVTDSSPAEVDTADNCSEAVSFSVDDEMCLPIKTSNGKSVLICL